MNRDFPNTYVAFLDILGFKELVTNNEHSELLKIYDIFNSLALDSVSLYQFKQTADNQINRDLSNVIINSLVISDSVILWTNDLSLQSFYDLLHTVRMLLSHGVHIGIPLRGSIVVGPITIKNEQIPSVANNFHLTFLGKSVVEAYISCERQNWSGCVISEECIEIYKRELNSILPLVTDPQRLESLVSIENLEKRHFIKKYFVPYKDGNLKEEFTINWVNQLNPRLSDRSVRESFGRYNKKTDNWKVETLIKNTLAYCADCPTRIA